ncbi:MAG: hypothetical protein IPH44_13615 [Myxococcales bacterium]|nr:hypothetical protein [Myxococcales bacterium]MBK7193909.1 hypothetical protein [Myxococcales bacterium]MBP6843313.1 hypothetical protein [Kofleriaceae bacterium]
MVSPRTLARAALTLGAVAGGVAVGGPFGIGLALALATALRMLDGAGWWRPADRDARAEVIGGGALVGALALLLALALSAPIADATARSVEWSTLPVVRGSALQAVTLAAVVVAVALAAELTLRRWWLEAVAAGLGRAGVGRIGAVAGGVVAAAALEAAIAPLPGDRLGVAVHGAGLGLIYVGAGRRLGASLAARVVFEVGALALQALMLIG